MVARSIAGRLGAFVPHSPDALLAVALAVVAQIETWATPSFTDKLPMALLALGITLPVAWRRLAPVTALFVGLAFGITFGHFWPTVDSIYSILCLLIICYSIGAYARHRVGAASVALVVAIYFTGAVLDAVNHTGHHGPGDVGMLSFLVIGAWLIGRVVSHRAGQAATMAERAERLEREQELQAAEILARERARIARELHDVIAHSVSVMVIQAGAADTLLEKDPVQARASLRSVQDLGGSTVAELRRMLGILREHPEDLSLAPQPGITVLPALLQQFRDAGLDVDLSTEGQPKPLPPGVDLSAYRIVQEALTNTLRHAQPAHAAVRLAYLTDALDLEITDDGTNSASGDGHGDGDGDGHGHGLIGMRERATLYGGAFAAGPRPGGGYRVTARLPLNGGAR